MTSDDRSTIWKAIWEKKGADRNASILFADGFEGLLTLAEMDLMIQKVTSPLELNGTESIMDCGCGAGAFLDGLLKVHPGLKVSGLDYSATLLERARERFNGDFFVADLSELGFLPAASYDRTISFSAFQYLSSEAIARRAVEGMLRITKPGGMVYIGDVPDVAKLELANSIRKISHQAIKKVSALNPDHLFYPKELFLDISRENGTKIRIIDQTEFDLGNYQGARYRYSVYMTKK